MYSLHFFIGIDKEDIRDPNTEQKQIVYRNSTIAEQLSLKAPIDQTAPIKRSSERWKAAHGRTYFFFSFFLFSSLSFPSVFFLLFTSFPNLVVCFNVRFFSLYLSIHFSSFQFLFSSFRYHFLLLNVRFCFYTQKFHRILLLCSRKEIVL